MTHQNDHSIQGNEVSVSAVIPLENGMDESREATTSVAVDLQMIGQGAAFKDATAMAVQVRLY
jgi:hypothetical protein